MKNIKVRYTIPLIFLLTLLVGLTKAPLIAVDGNRGVFLLLSAVLLWNIQIIPGAYASFFILILIAATGDGNLEHVLAGFANPGLFFLLTVTLIGVSFARRGIVGYLVLRWAGFCRSARSCRLYCMAVTILMPLIIPAATVRTRLTEPIIKELAIMNGFSENGPFVRSTALIVGGMSSVATLAYMTGGGNSVMASQLIGRFTGSDISWLSWLTLMLPLAWLIIILCSFFLPFTFPGKESTQGHGGNMLHSDKKLDFQEKTGLFIVIIMIVFWISEPLTGIDPVIVAFGGIVLLAVPGIELLREEDLKNLDWHTIILLGTAFSLGKQLNEEGVGEKAAGMLVHNISFINPDVPGLSFLVLLSVLCLGRIFFISPVSFLTLAMPVVLPFSQSMNLNPFVVGLSTAIVAGTVNVLPTQSPGLIMLHSTYKFTFKEFLSLSWVSTLVAVLVIIFAYFIYWPWMLNIVGR